MKGAKITRRMRTLGWAFSDESEPTVPTIVGTVAQVLDARCAALSERRRALGPDAREPRHEVLWLGARRLGELATLDLLQLCRLVPGGPNPTNELTLATRP